MAEPCKHDDKMMKMAEDIASIKATILAIDRRINGSIDDIKLHIAHGTKWRLSIVGVGAGLLISIMTFMHWSGRLCEVVDRHERQLQSTGDKNDYSPDRHTS